MNPKYWWSFGVVFVGVIALIMEMFESDEFDPGSLPPPAAGAPAEVRTSRPSCEGVVYGVSEDGIRFVRESGGSPLIAAVIDNDLAFYELGRYGYLETIDSTTLDTGITRRLEHALLKCNARYLPSGVNFAYR